jgi:hypothetical protein
MSLEPLGERCIERLARREILVRQNLQRQAKVAGAGRPGRILAIAQNHLQTGRQRPLQTGLRQAQHVGTLA